MEPTQVRLTIPDSVDPTVLMGPADVLLRRVEASFDALISVRGSDIRVSGPADAVERVTSVFSRLILMVEAGEVPTVDDVDLIIDQVRGQTRRERSLEAPSANDAILTRRGRSVRPKSEGQRRYVEAIRSNTITFGIGPAGSGKTYLAIAMAVSALRRHEVSRIVLTRPVVEAGESLGFLPGTLEEKLDPYVRPLYDALFEMCDHDQVLALVEQGVIEVAPLAFMRGRTFNDSFVILDEAQNTTPEQMKMFLTRLGFSSTFVITADATQRDVKGRNGLDSARHTLTGIDGIAFVDLDRNDIVRSSLVARIVDAYARAEAKERGETDAAVASTPLADADADAKPAQAASTASDSVPCSSPCSSVEEGGPHEA